MTATNVRVTPKFEETAKKKVQYKLTDKGKALLTKVVATIVAGTIVTSFGSNLVRTNQLNEGIESLQSVEVNPEVFANDTAYGSVNINGDYIELEMDSLEFVNIFKECVNILEQAKDLNLNTDNLRFNSVEGVDELVSKYFDNGVPNVEAISSLINGDNQNLTEFESILPHLKNWTYKSADMYKDEMVQASKRTMADIFNKALGTNFDGNDITLMNRDVTDAREYYVITTDKYGIEDRYYLGDNLDSAYYKYFTLVNNVHDSNPQSVNELKELIAQSNAMVNTADAISMATDLNKIREGREPRAKDKAVIDAIEEIQESRGMEESSKGRSK